LREEALPVGQVATALNVSPQAASRAALVLERFGYVERVASVVDGRSRVVALTTRGHDLITRAEETFVECEKAYEKRMGRAFIGRMGRDLDALRVGLELALQSDPTVQIQTAHSIGSVILIALCAKRYVVSLAKRAGHDQVRRSHVEVLTTIGTCDVRVSDIAREVGVTRQAVSSTARELERLGYVERRPDPNDRRAVLITPSIGGAKLLDDVTDAVREFEARCQGVLGESRWSRFVRDLSELSATVSGEAGTLPAPPAVRLAEPDGAADLVSLAKGLRSQLGPRRAARLGALLTSGDPPSLERTSGRRAARAGFR
jgi:DNA-binding MarR family transcriptional regulator